MIFNRLKGEGSDPDAPLPSVGEDRRVYAIGDIHGRLDLLDALLMRIIDDHEARPRLPIHFILLGDLVDRGPKSAQVVDRVLTLMPVVPTLHCLKGNHEEVFVMAARGDPQAAAFLIRIGGLETLASYGLPSDDPVLEDPADIARWMLSHVPRAHVDALDAFPDTVEMGDYLFVHAGIRPRVAIDRQDPRDLRWIRGEFLDWRKPLPRMVIHGHSIRAEVDEQANRIGIDTGAFASGRLTAIGLEGTRRWFIDTTS